MLEPGHSLLRLLCRSLNIMVSPAGEGNLLSEVSLVMPVKHIEPLQAPLLLPIIFLRQALVDLVSEK